MQSSGATSYLPDQTFATGRTVTTIVPGTGTAVGTLIYTYPGTPPYTYTSTQVSWSSINSFASDNSNVYFGVGGAVLKVSTNGGALTPIAPTFGTPGASGITLDSTSVYWIDNYVPGSNGANLNRVSKSGGSVTTISTTTGSIQSLTVDSSSVYWAESNGSTTSIKKAGLNGGAATTIATIGGGVFQMVVGSSNIYYLSNGIFEVGVNGGTTTELYSLAWLWQFAVDTTSFYFWNYPNNMLSKAPIGGGSITAVSSQCYGTAGTIAVDAANIYYMGTCGGEGGLYEIPINGGTPTYLAAEGNALVIDSSSVYFIDNGGIEKVSK